MIYVPATGDSKLISKVREALATALDPTGCKTLVMEQPGPSVRQSLVRSDPLFGGAVAVTSAHWIRLERIAR